MEAQEKISRIEKEILALRFLMIADTAWKMRTVELWHKVRRLWLFMQLLAFWGITGILNFWLGPSYGLGFVIGTSMLVALRYAYSRRSYEDIKYPISGSFRIDKPKDEV